MEKKTKVWIPVSHKLPPVKTKVIRAWLRLNKTDKYHIISKITNVKTGYVKRIINSNMKKYYDRNNRLLTQGNVIDLNQTINGRRYLDVISLDPLKIRYSKSLNYDWTQSNNDEDYEFEYDPELILDGGMFGEVDWEIVFNNFGQTDLYK